MVAKQTRHMTRSSCGLVPGTVCYHPLVKLPGQHRRPSEPAQQEQSPLTCLLRHLASLRSARSAPSSQNASSAESPSQYFQRRPGLRVRPIMLGLFLSLCPAFAFAQPQQTSGNVIRFVRNPDVAPDFKLDDLDGKPLNSCRRSRQSRALEFLGHVVRPLPRRNTGFDRAADEIQRPPANHWDLGR